MDITIWERLNEKTKRFEHNHIQDGHAQDDNPTSQSDTQTSSWQGAEWQRIYGYLIKGVVRHMDKHDYKAIKIIEQCKEQAYGNAFVPNKLEGDFGRWEDWQEVIANAIRETWAEGYELQKALAPIRLKFQSGNSVPVERATISTTEWASIEYVLSKL